MNNSLLYAVIHIKLTKENTEASLSGEWEYTES